MFGFGGIYEGKTDHCFPLNFNNEDPEVDKIEGVMEAYANALNNISLSGPTYFSSVLEE